MKSVRYAVRTYLIQEGKVLAITYNYGNQKGWFDIPGGKIEEGETPEQTAIREVKEETGVDIKNPRRCGKVIVEYPDRIYDFIIFTVNEYSGEIQNCEENNSEFINIEELSNIENTLPSAKILNDIYEKFDSEEVNIKLEVDDNSKIIKFSNNIVCEEIFVEKLKREGIFLDSITENNAIKLFDSINFETIKSIGISTAGFIEGYYSEKGKKVIATNLDALGLEYTKEILKDMNNINNVEFRLEDASLKSIDDDNSIDIIYSRLCLHYLSDEQLASALKDCYRILKTNGIVFIVVKSNNDKDAISGMTTRRFHSQESMEEVLNNVGFKIEDSTEITERVCKDYERKCLDNEDGRLLQVVAVKK